MAATTAPPHDDKPSFLLWGALGLAMLLVMGVVAYGAIALLGDDAADASYPDSWDARVEPFARAVEAQRRLQFAHPVAVEFLSAHEYDEAVAAEHGVTDEWRAQLVGDTALLQAVGLVATDSNLLDDVNRLAAAAAAQGTVSYSYGDERLRIRGTKLTPMVQTALVHELTHALQDQRFDTGNRLEMLSRQPDPALAGGLRAVVEGDAQRTQDLWEKTLRPKQRRAVDRARAAVTRATDKKLRAIPEIVPTMTVGPYVLARSMLDLAVEDSGPAVVDQILVKPPTSEEHLLDPWTFLDDDSVPRGVKQPGLEPGETKAAEGTVGAAGWLFMLGERIPSPAALTATDGWDGDQYVAYQREGRSCVRVHYRAETSQDLEEMRRALVDWTDARPGDTSATSALAPRTLVFETCADPSGGRAHGSGPEDVLTLVNTRIRLATQVLTIGDDHFARCATDRIVDRFTADQLNDPKLKAQLQRVVAPCR